MVNAAIEMNLKNLPRLSLIVVQETRPYSSDASSRLLLTENEVSVSIDIRGMQVSYETLTKKLVRRSSRILRE